MKKLYVVFFMKKKTNDGKTTFKNALYTRKRQFKSVQMDVEGYIWKNVTIPQ